MAGGVSLREGSQGGFLDDAEAVIKECHTGPFKYQGNPTQFQGLIVTFDAGLDEPHIENYSSGKTEPTEDGTGFQTILSIKAKAKLFIDSLIALDFPNVDNDVHVFEGAKVHLKRQALPKMPGIDKEGDKDKTVLLVDKIISLPGNKRPTAASAGKATATKSAPGTAKAASATSNGSGSESVIAAVQAALAKAEGMTMTLPKLVNAVFLDALKAKMPSAEATALKKTLTLEWLTQNADAGGWINDAETISIPQ